MSGSRQSPLFYKGNLWIMDVGRIPCGDSVLLCEGPVVSWACTQAQVLLLQLLNTRALLKL